MLFNSIKACIVTLVISQSVFVYAGGKLPKWVSNPKPDTLSHFYGVGEGNSKTNAQQAALEAVAGKILTTIESNLEVSVKSSNGAVNENINSNVKSNIAKTNLSGFELLQTKKIKKNYWAEVRVDKQKIYDANWTEYVDITTSLASDFEQIKSKSVLSLMENGEDLLKDLNTAKTKLTICKAINPNLDFQKHAKQLKEYEQQLSDKLDNMQIYIDASPDMQPLAKKVANLFSDQGISATTQSPKTNTPKITLTGQYRNEQVMNQQGAFADLSIEVTDEFGNTILTKTHNLKGSSTISFEKARVAAANRYIHDIDLDGVEEYFGLIDTLE